MRIVFLPWKKLLSQGGETSPWYHVSREISTVYDLFYKLRDVA